MRRQCFIRTGMYFIQCYILKCYLLKIFKVKGFLTSQFSLFSNRKAFYLFIRVSIWCKTSLYDSMYSLFCSTYSSRYLWVISAQWLNSLDSLLEVKCTFNSIEKLTEVEPDQIDYKLNSFISI